MVCPIKLVEFYTGIPPFWIYSVPHSCVTIYSSVANVGIFKDKLVALGIVAARLDYCNTLLSSDNLRKLKVTQNALARVVCQAERL